MFEPQYTITRTSSWPIYSGEIVLYRLPDDIWLVDLDATKLISPTGTDQDLPPLPEPEGSVLKNHLKQVRNDLTFIIYGVGKAP